MLQIINIFPTLLCISINQQSGTVSTFGKTISSLFKNTRDFLILFTFSDAVMHNIYVTMYGSALTSVFIMETYTFCITKCFFSANQAFANRYKTSSLSISIISAIAIQIILDFILPFVIAESQFYIATYFIAVFNFFFVIPLISIVTHQNSFKFLKQFLASTLTGLSNNQVLPIDCNL